MIMVLPTIDYCNIPFDSIDWNPEYTTFTVSAVGCDWVCYDFSECKWRKPTWSERLDYGIEFFFSNLRKLF